MDVDAQDSIFECAQSRLGIVEKLEVQITGVFLEARACF